MASLVKEILPLPYLQEQVELAIDGAVSYLDKEEAPTTGKPIAEPDVYVDLRPILGTRAPTPLGAFPVEGTAKPVIVGFIRNKLLNSVEFLPPPGGTTQERLDALAGQLDETLNQLRDPSFPIQLPSLSAIGDEFREEVYDEAISLLSARIIPLSVIQGLEEADDEIKAKLRLPDPNNATIEALSVAVEPLVEPLIDAAFDQFRDDQLDEQDRFDPIARLAKNRGETKAEALDNLDEARDWLDRAKSLGSWIAIVVIVLGSLLLGLLHLPRVRSALGWPGLTLILSGALFLGLAIVLKSQLPDRLESFVEGRGGGCVSVAGAESSFSPEFCELAVDVTRSMATDVSGDFIGPSIVVLIIGAALIAASFVAGKVMPRIS